MSSRDAEDRYSQPAPTSPTGGELSWSDGLAFFGLALLTLIVPFVFSSEMTEQFLAPKELFAKLAIALLIAGLTLRFLLEGRIRLAHCGVQLPLALLFGFSALSLAWNFHVPSALRDLPGLALILLLVPLVANTLRKAWQAETLLWIMAFAGAATATLGIMEAYNLYFRFDAVQGLVFARDEVMKGQFDPQAWYLPLFPQIVSLDRGMGGSIISTLGNRNYLATFTMFTAFLPLGFFFYYARVWVRGLALALFGLTILGMLVTRCRAALLGLIAGLAFMALMLLIFDRHRQFLKRNRLFFGAIAVFVAVGFLFAVNTAKMPSFLEKVVSTFSLDSKTGNSYERLWVWYATWRSFAPYPLRWLAGNGVGSFKHFFQLQQAEVFDEPMKETFTPLFFRQAHNDWLQLVSELGLIGLMLVLFVGWRFFRAVWQMLRAEISEGQEAGLHGRHALLIALTGAMVAQLTAAVPDFPFHRLESALYAVLLLAIGAVVAKTRFFQVELPEISVPARQGLLVALLVVAIGAAGWLTFHELLCRQADVLVRQSDLLLMGRPDAERLARARGLLQRAIAIDPVPGEPYLKLATVFELEGRGQEAVEAATKALKNININGKLGYQAVLLRLAQVYDTLLHDPKQALGYAREGLYLTTGDARPQMYYYIGKNALALNQWELGSDMLRRAMKDTVQFPQAAACLADALVERQQWAEAVEIIASLSHKLHDANPVILGNMGLWAYRGGQLATATSALKRAIELSPDTAKYKLDLGMVYLRSGSHEEALPLLEKVCDAPDLSDAAKAEVRLNLASTTVTLFTEGMTAMQSNRTDEGTRKLRLITASPYLPPEKRQQAEMALKAAPGTLPPQEAEK